MVEWWWSRKWMASKGGWAQLIQLVSVQYRMSMVNFWYAKWWCRQSHVHRRSTRIERAICRLLLFSRVPSNGRIRCQGCISKQLLIVFFVCLSKLDLPSSVYLFAISVSVDRYLAPSINNDFSLDQSIRVRIKRLVFMQTKTFSVFLSTEYRQTTHD